VEIGNSIDPILWAANAGTAKVGEQDHLRLFPEIERD
jgi:hypothetical protein